MVETEHVPEGVLRLEAVQPLFRGHQRLVFQHPEQPDLLIKVLRAEYVRDKFGPGSSLHNRLRRCREYQPFLREFREYLVASARAPYCLPYIQEIVGLVWTDLGLGMVVRRIMGNHDAPALTLSDLLHQERGLSALQRSLLEAFFQALETSDVIVDDLNDCNIVFGRTGSGTEHFVLIDGVGSSTLLPIKDLCPAANRWSKRRRIARLRAKVAARAQGLPI